MYWEPLAADASPLLRQGAVPGGYAYSQIDMLMSYRGSNNNKSVSGERVCHRRPPLINSTSASLSLSLSLSRAFLHFDPLLHFSSPLQFLSLHLRIT